MPDELVRPTRGSVKVGGEQVTRPLKRVGMAFQNATLLPWRSIRDNVLLPLEIVEPFRSQQRRQRGEQRERAEMLLKSVGLTGFGSRMPWELSGGMQQRAQLCRALVHEPAILLLDEPFGALDAFTREELWGVLQALWLERRFTVILVTHELRETGYLADKVHVMCARPRRVIASYAVPFSRPVSGNNVRAGLRRARSRAAREYRCGAGMTWTALHRIARATALILVALWWLGVKLFHIESYVLPTPFEAVEAIVKYRAALLH